MVDLVRPGAGPGHPAAFHFGPGHLIVYGTGPFLALYGASCLGLPAREVMVDLPAEAFALMDRVLLGGRPLAVSVETGHGDRRLVVVPRRDPGGETYGVTTHLVAVRARAPG